jgi:antirestriction protein ArdC
MTSTKPSLNDLLGTLNQRLAEQGHNLLPVLGLMSRFSKYSLANQLLIYVQRPTATKVFGFHTWLRQGYSVRKGEKGIAIYAPVRFRTDSDTNTDDDMTSRPTRFRVAYVFDISQVEAINAPVDDSSAITTPAAPLACLDALKAFVTAQQIQIAYVHLPPGNLGSTDGKCITLALGQEPHMEFATLVHETTHALLHFTGERPDLTTRETEAEAVAWLVCEQLGLPDTDLSIDYIRAYRGTPDTLTSSLDRIRTTAQRIVAALVPD